MLDAYEENNPHRYLLIFFNGFEYCPVFSFQVIPIMLLHLITARAAALPVADKQGSTCLLSGRNQVFF
jgi:hypothetical protein